jgi:hypothetical protein
MVIRSTKSSADVTVNNISLKPTDDAVFGFTADATRSGSTLKATPLPNTAPAGYEYKYQWEKKSSSGSSYSEISGETDSSYTTTSNGTYRCRVYLVKTGTATQVGSAAYTQAVQRSSSSSYNLNYSDGNSNTGLPGLVAGTVTTTAYTASRRTAASGTSVILTAVPDPAFRPNGYSYATSGIGTARSYPDATDNRYPATATTSSTTYYCRVTAGAAGAVYAPDRDGFRRQAGCRRADGREHRRCLHVLQTRRPRAECGSGGQQLQDLRSDEQHPQRLNVMKVSEAQANSKHPDEVPEPLQAEIVFASSNDNPVVYEDLTDTLTLEDGAYYLR